MRIAFVGIRKNIEDIISGPQKVANCLYNKLIEKYDDIYYYGLFEEGDVKDKNVRKINNREYKGPMNKLGQFIRDNNIEVLYIARYYSALALYAVFLKMVHKVKIVYTVHGLVAKEKEINKSFKFYNAWCEELLLKKTDKIIAISGALREELLKYYPDLKPGSITVINNGVSVIPLQEKLDIRQIYSLGRDKKILFTVGTRPIKNIETILEQFAENKDLYNSSYLLVAGETDTDYARYLIDKYKQYDNIKFIGYVDPNWMNNIYEESDLYIQISKFETFGMSIVEALLHKKQVIISDKLPIAEYFSGEEAVHYNGDKDNLGNLILDVLNNKKPLNEAGYQKAMFLFNWDNISEEYYKAFRDS